MNNVLRLALNDLRLTVRDRPAFLWMLALPVAMMWFFGQIGGGSSGPPKVALAVVDRDGGWLARALADDLASERFEIRSIAPADLETAKDKVRTLAIPEGFTQKVLAGEQQALRLEKEPGSSETAGLAAQAHVTRAIGRTLSRLVEMGVGNEEPASLSPEAALERLREMSSRPLLVKLEVSSAGRGRPVPSGFAQSVPGILTMMVLMTTVIYGAVFITIEKRDGMLRRQGTLPLSRAQIFLGKLAGRVAVAAVQIALQLCAGWLIFGISWGDSPGGLILVLACYAAAVAGLSTLLGALLSTPEQASAVGWILGMVLAGLGGCWWPSEVMPRWMWTAAHALPTAWAMDALHALISFGRGIDGVLLPSAALAGFAALFSALGARFLRYA